MHVHLPRFYAETRPGHLVPPQTLLLLVLVLLYCCSSGAFASAGAGGAADPHAGGLGMHPHRIDARYWLPVGAPTLQTDAEGSLAQVALTAAKVAELFLTSACLQSKHRCGNKHNTATTSCTVRHSCAPLSFTATVAHVQALALLPAVPLAFFLWEECCRASRRRTSSSGTPFCFSSAPGRCSKLHCSSTVDQCSTPASSA
jgi:hypothetical protein